MDEHAPVTETEAHQVELFAHNQWKLRRAARMEVEALEKSAPAEGGPVSLIDEVMRVARYTVSIRRSYTVALAELRRLQTDRNRSNPISANSLTDDLLRDLRRPAPQRSEPPPRPRGGSQSSSSRRNAEVSVIEKEQPAPQLDPFGKPAVKLAEQ